MKKIKIYSFFAGAGFLDLGFENAGYEIEFVNEYNKSFLEAYKYSRKKMQIDAPTYGYYCGDINDLLIGDKKKELQEQMKDKAEHELIGFIGGPPCPDYAE